MLCLELGFLDWATDTAPSLSRAILRREPYRRQQFHIFNGQIQFRVFARIRSRQGIRGGHRQPVDHPIPDTGQNVRDPHDDQITGAQRLGFQLRKFIGTQLFALGRADQNGRPRISCSEITVSFDVLAAAFPGGPRTRVQPPQTRQMSVRVFQSRAVLDCDGFTSCLRLRSGGQPFPGNHRIAGDDARGRLEVFFLRKKKKKKKNARFALKKAPSAEKKKALTVSCCRSGAKLRRRKRPPHPAHLVPSAVGQAP